MIPSDTQFGGQGVEATDIYELCVGIASVIQWWAMSKGRADRVTVKGTDSRTGLSVAFDGREVCYLTIGGGTDWPVLHVGSNLDSGRMSAVGSEQFSIPVQCPVDIAPRKRIRRYEIENILITVERGL